ncbi:hypothetical protein FACS1894120_2010 [Clostridia bacterium]|nr:hypothetical protein FACS1894120_2010 [Clostridia bacterium]
MFLLIDGNSIACRAFYGMAPFANSGGTQINAVTGFISIYVKLCKRFKPDYAACCFDVARETFRNKIFSDYKGTRHESPRELREQLGILRELCPKLGLPVVFLEGYEADDLIGTLSAACTQKEERCIISTGDRDSFQLINEWVSVNYAGKKGDTLYDEYELYIEKKYKPSQVVELKALMGDPSDNIPGIRGIGEKTAMSLLEEYGTLDNIIAASLDGSLKGTIGRKIAEYHETANMCRRLAQICTNVPIPTELAPYRVTPPSQAGYAELHRLEMPSSIKKLTDYTDKFLGGGADTLAPGIPGTAGIPVIPAIPGIPKNRPIPVTPKKAKSVAAKASGSVTAKAAESDTAAAAKPELNPNLPKNISFDLKNEYSAALKRLHENETGEYSLFPLEIEKEQRIIERLKKTEFDICLAAYLLGKPAPNTAAEVTAADVNSLYTKMEREPKLMNLLREVEMPLAYILAEMEVFGYVLNVIGLEKFGERVDKVLSDNDDYFRNYYGDIRESLRNDLGGDFDLDNPKHIEHLYFNRFRHSSGAKNNGGVPDTSTEHLLDISSVNPTIAVLLEHRRLYNLKNDYIIGLPKAAKVDTEGCFRINPTYLQTAGPYERVATAEPNLQKLPVRYGRGRSVRDAFTVKSGNCIITADYIQLEMRILAHLSEDPIMLDAFYNSMDIHDVTAWRLLKRMYPPAYISEEKRNFAKTINYGMIGGLTARRLSGHLKIEIEQAQRYIDAFMKEYSGVRDYFEKTVERAHKKGYVETMFGRKRRVPELKTAKTYPKGRGIAINTPIQSAAADIIKIAMIKLHKRLEYERTEGMFKGKKEYCRIILQTHDEIVVEGPGEHYLDIFALVEEELENPVTLNVPLPIFVRSGSVLGML